MNQYLKRCPLLVFCVLTITSYGQTQREIDNLYTFSKLYGYVRYFHPSDEAASIDWERFAIYGAQKVQGSKNAKELQQNLQALFCPIAPTVQLYMAGKKVAFNKAALMVSNPDSFKTIAWQHSGVDVGNPGNIYQSARTNRPRAQKAPVDAFAPLSAYRDATPFRSKEFIFRGRVKMTGDGGSGHLFVRVDRSDKKRGFFDNMGNRPIQAGNWETYEIKGLIDAAATGVNFGVFLKGTGTLEFDDLSLQVKEESEWKEVYVNDFTTEEKGKAPQSLVGSPGAAYVISVEQDEAARQSYVSIRSLDGGGNNAMAHTTLFDKYPQVGEIVEKEIGSGLKAIIPLALYGMPGQTFPAGDKAQLEKLKATLQTVNLKALKGDNLYTRLGDVVITWNVFQHFYPYFDVVKTDWNSALKVAIADAYSDKTEVDFQKTLQRLTAKLKDGHGWVSLNTKAYYYPQFSWEWIEDELVITQVIDSSLPIAVGNIVKKIDGRDAKDYFNEVHQHISAATDGHLRYRAQTESLKGDKDSRLSLAMLKGDNSLQEVSVTRTQTMRTTVKPIKDTIKSLGNGIMYVNLDIAPTQAIENAMPELEKSRVIIFDLRGYPRSDPGMIQHLLNEADTSTQWMKIPQVVYPDGERIAGYQNHGWRMKPEKPHLTAKAIFLIDGRAISYAESYVSFIEHYKLATIVGQPTAGTNGNVNPFTLPGGYYISWTGMRVQKHDGSQHHGVGIRPHIYVERTIKGVREGRDEFLEKALEIAGKPM